MDVKQLYELINTTTKEVLGDSTVVQEDLSNVVDLGTAIFSERQLDNYVKSLIDHIGKVVFVNRVYGGSYPTILKDGWMMGSIMEKVTIDKLPEAEEDEAWNLEDGESYDPFVVKLPQVSYKLYNQRATFKIRMTIREENVKEAFSSVAQLNGFVSMIYNSIDESMTVKIDSFISRIINDMALETIYEEYDKDSASYDSKSGIRAINLLYLFKQQYPSTTLTAETCIYDPDFIRFATNELGVIKGRMAKISQLFNLGAKPRFTTEANVRMVLLNDFASASKTFLQSDTYNKELVALPQADTVPYWQGSGESYALSDITKIMAKTASGHEMTVTGVLGVMFDKDAVVYANEERKSSAIYNPDIDATHMFWRWMGQGIADKNENFVVFFVA